LDYYAKLIIAPPYGDVFLPLATFDNKELRSESSPAASKLSVFVYVFSESVWAADE